MSPRIIIFRVGSKCLLYAVCLLLQRKGDSCNMFKDPPSMKPALIIFKVYTAHVAAIT